ncbi:MAG: CBS domain-containing protein [Nitrosopumilaceae archaeon]|uniref:CBS domain-containing protein n=1 Tax=Candidatus Nitrosomaritimum aestuariumsis TaxID=3342354 RepID=A0AC60W2B5_9ARCH|nr:CBS domain-containing protein [Nitrosopumilaceae archaeon]
MVVSNVESISELTLDEMLSTSLTDTPCVYLNQEREVWVATEMCVQYLESSIDSIVIRNDDLTPVGIVGGYDLLNHIRKNPTREFQYENKVKEIMFEDLPIVEKETRFKDLMERWKQSRRAFAITPNSFQGYSPVSARKMLDVGIRSQSNITISSMPKKSIVTFSLDDSLGKIIDSMFENNTRKLMLEYSNQFISDRIILEEISKMLKFQPEVDNFLDIPVSQIELERVNVLKEDVNLNQLSLMLYKMDHPYVIYKDISVSPWDICLTLLSEDVTSRSSDLKKACPHCGGDISWLV